MQYRWITEIEAFERMAAAWDAVVDAAEDQNPFLLSDFISGWWRQFHPGRALRVLVIFDGDKLVGGLPLYIQRAGGCYGWARLLSYIGSPAANYTEPLYGPQQTRLWSVMAEACAALPGWDVLKLTDARTDSCVARELQDWQPEQGQRYSVNDDHENWAIDLTAGKDAYYATLSKKMRRDLRSKRRHAESRYGALTLRTVTGHDEVTQAFEQFIMFQVGSFSARERSSTFSDVRYRDFFREWLLVMDQVQRLDAHVLYAGETILAVSFGYRYGPGFNWVLTAYNHTCRYVRPGYLLIEELIDWVLARGETRYNWYGYDRFYKWQWCNERTSLYRITLFNQTVRGRIYEWSHAVEQRLRAQPRLVSIVRGCREQVRRVQGVARAH